MIIFCECGSIKIAESCSNKKCKNHIKGTQKASMAQIEYLKSMVTKLDYDDSDQDYNSLTVVGAMELIDEMERMC